MPELSPHEIARRALPWVLLPRYRNVLLNTPIKTKVASTPIALRNLEIYIPKHGGIYIPGAASFLYAPYLAVEYEIVRNEFEPTKGHILIKGLDGYVMGFMPDGRFSKFSDRVLEKVAGRTLEFEGEDPSDFNINMVARNLARLEAGRIFAIKLKNYLSKHGFSFIKSGVGSIRTVVISEGNVRTTVTIPTTFFDVRYNDVEVTVPGIVPGILTHIARGSYDPVPDEAREVLNDIFNRMKSVATRYMDYAVVFRISKTTFTYVAGQVDAPQSVKKKYEGAPVHLANSKIPGGRITAYADLDNNLILMNITMVPFNPPAALTLNYPPLNLAPIAMVVNEYADSFDELIRFAYWRAKKYGLKLSFEKEAYITLKDAGITLDDIKKPLHEGYPKIESLIILLDKLERLGDLTSMLQLSIGELKQVDQILIDTLKPVEEKEEAKKPVKRAKRREKVPA